MFNGKDNGSITYYEWFVNEFRHFVLAQQALGKAANANRFPADAAWCQFQYVRREAQIDKAIAERAIGH